MRMRIRSQSGLRGAWVFAILWNLIAAPATLLVAAPAIRQGPGVAWVALVFPVAGAGLLIWAVHLTLRSRRFGTSLFEMAGEAAAVGGPLRGTITARNLPGDATLRLTLTCINRVVSGSGKNRSTSEKVVWQEEQTLPPHALVAGPEGPAVPVAFVLPDGAPPTNDADPDNRILWRLQAYAAIPGVNYSGQFEVPVVAPGATGGDLLSVPLPETGAPARPEGSRIIVEPAPQGGTIFTLHTWILSTRVTVSPGRLAITCRLLGLAWTREVASADIRDVRLKVGMQFGLTPYYDIVIGLASGRRATLSAMLRNRREAEWLGASIQRGLSGRLS